MGDRRDKYPKSACPNEFVNFDWLGLTMSKNSRVKWLSNLCLDMEFFMKN